MTTTTTEQEELTKENSSPTLENLLTKEQFQVYHQLLNWCSTEESEYPAAVLKGYAGVGKTFTLTPLIKTLTYENGFKVGVTAPTHKAVTKLKETAITGVDYRTIHSALALKEKRNFFTGEITYEADPGAPFQPPIANFDILIIDEASMVDDNLFNHLIRWMKAGLKVIFVGDPVQIPPVGQSDCIPFRKGQEWNFLVLELTEIIRQKEGNPILTFATEVRKNYKTGKFWPGTNLNELEEGIKVVDKTDEDLIFRTYFDTDLFRENSDYMKVIGWRNAVVNQYNSRIRSILYGPDADKYVIGEKLIMSDSYAPMNKVVIHNNVELVVTDIDTKPFVFHYTIGYEDQVFKGEIYNLKVEFITLGGTKRETIPVIHQNSEVKLNKLIRDLVDTAKKSYGGAKRVTWRSFFKLRKELAWVNYNYAITAHKAQGSTYENCLVLKWDLDKRTEWCRSREELALLTEERNRLLYTSCTRPRKLLMIEP